MKNKFVNPKVIDMRKNVFWMLAALMLAMVTVSCSSDDNEPDEPYVPYIGVPQVPYGEVVDLDTLPDPIKAIIMRWGEYWEDFILLEGTWLGQHAYWFMNGFSSTFPNFFYMEDGTKSYYIHEKVDWSTWRCTYHYMRHDKEHNGNE